MFPVSSPFAALLGTNYVPDAEEFKQIANFLKEPQARLDELNNKIGRMETELLALKTERDALQDHIRGHRSLLSPVRRLPDDVIREVFVRCLDEFPIRSTKHAPLLLTTICRSWNRIALATPRLWNSIHIFIPYFAPYLSDGVRAVPPQDRILMEQRQLGVERWLNRSGSVPISFSLAFSDNISSIEGSADQPSAVLHSFINAILRYHSRWKMVRIMDLQPAFLQEPLLSLKPDSESFPNLESLEVEMIAFNSTDSDSQMQCLESLLRSPSLQRLKLDISDIPQVPQTVFDLPIRWDQITELSLRQSPDSVEDAWSARQMLTVLTRVRGTIHTFSFESAFITPSSQDYAKGLDLGVVQLPVLEKLSVELLTISAQHPRGSPTFEEIIQLLGFLYCPALDELTFRTGSATLLSATNFPFEQFIQQSGCSLRKFATDILLPAPVLRACLLSMPSLTTLAFGAARYRQVPPQNGFLEALAEPDNQVCPSLQDLSLTNTNVLDADQVIRLVERRPLKSLQVRFAGHTDEIYRTQVATLREKGIDVMWLCWANNKMDFPDIGLPRIDSPFARWPRSSGNRYPSPNVHCEY